MTVSTPPDAGIPVPSGGGRHLSVLPWIDGQRWKNRRADDRECRGRVAYSLRASDMRAVGGRQAPAAAKAGAQ